MTSFSGIILVALFGIGDFAAATGYGKEVQPQVPNVIDALYNNGNPPLATDYMYLMKSAVPGVTYPTHGYIPYTSFTCSQVSHPGFFADIEADCQVYRRCDHRGDMTSYLCPNSTLFNQLTLNCDWWFNVDCVRAREFYSYANSRIHNKYVQLHDDKVDYGYKSAAGYGSNAGSDYGGTVQVHIATGGSGYGQQPVPAYTNNRVQYRRSESGAKSAASELSGKSADAFSVEAPVKEKSLKTGSA